MAGPPGGNLSSTDYLHGSGTVSVANKMKDACSTGHVYPLRSRLRRESMRRQLHAMQCAPKAFDELPTEVLFRITHYLSIQDVFRLQLVCRRLKAIVERYLLLVKRINFSNGLPFAFLPESINDVALKRILSRTPEVTHILGFYPHQITGSYPSDCHSLGSTRMCSNTSLTYAGIISAFRICPKLRSVELMDVELMGKLVHYLPRIKFHGMFRNRPDSWDCEYAVPLPSEDSRLTVSQSQSGFETRSDIEALSAHQPDDQTSHSLASNRPVLGCHASAFFCSLTAASAAISSTSKCKPYELLSAADIKRLANKCLSAHRSPSRPNSSHTSPTKTPSNMHSSLPLSASVFAHKCAVKLAGLATWFEPAGESPLGQGSPSTVPHFLPTRSVSFGNNLLPWYDQANLQPVPPHANATGGLDAFRNIAMAPYIQPGLPPIEAELIAAAPIGRDGVSNNQADGAPVALNNHGPVMALAFGAVFISPHLLGHVALGGAAPVLLAQPSGGVMDGLVLANQNHGNRRRMDPPQARHHVAGGAALPARQDDRNPIPAANRPVEGRPAAQQQPFVPRAAQRVPVRHFVRQLYSNQGSLNSHGPWLVSPLPNHSSWIGLPHTITNLTKLDLASVAISAIPRLDNIKYLHLKWVVFTSADPFANFSASKLQSFVMNNCSGPSRVFRFVRIFYALARAPQLMRLELVGTRFVGKSLIRSSPVC
ncbi:unnamed protein product [Echinostoma caproni]|uniref:F-box domain-containing protein n=1 Tax=Echinostoma caproni TaxID=27848 RepID=A0A183BDQ3_9TREM|nr:unnamed protein product [Echinostoma caproni]